MTKKSVGLDEFKSLPLLEQLNILHKEGVHVGKRRVDDKPVILYQVNNFYVEVYYREYRKDIAELLVSENVEMVHPYLSQIRIDGLDEATE